MIVLVSGISGYVGSLVAERLRREGHEVRGFARHARRVSIDVPVVEGDAVTGIGLERALEGVDVAYFLIHSMETAVGADPFASREATAARRFADAARAAGVRRIVYLGGPVPPGPPSAHLRSRLEVERVLLEAIPGSIALRASIVIGARSRSFRFLVRLVERLPVLALPAWGSNRTAPIDERDVIAMLVRCAEVRMPADPTGSHTFDAVGLDIVSYRRLIERVAELMLVARPTFGLGRFTLTPIASRVAAVIADEDPALVEPLMESLETDLLPGGDDAAMALDVRLHSLDAAIEHALGEWERTEPIAAR